MRYGWVFGLTILGCSGDGGQTDAGTTPSSDATDVEVTDGSTDTETGTDTGTSVERLPPFESGSRLTAVFWDAGEDAEVLSHFNDSSLEIDCEIARGGDGDLRCFPNVFVNVVYLDDACTEPAFYWEPCNGPTPPEQVIGAAPSCGDARSGVPYETGEIVMQDFAYDASCTRLDFGKVRTYYRAVERPVSDYVSFTQQDVAVAEGIGVRQLQGTDGSSVLTSPVSMAEEQRCTPISLGVDFDLFCMPGERANDIGRSHTDASCKNGDLAFTFTAATCEPPTYVLSQELHPTCDINYWELHLAGDLVPQEDVYWGRPGGCFPSTQQRTFFEVGALAGDVLSPIGTTEVGAGRLQAEYWSTSSDAPVLPVGAQWVDSTLGLSCTPMETEAGTKCLPKTVSRPVDSSSATYFADPACKTMPLAYHYETSCLAVEPPRLVAEYEPGLCGTPGPLQNVRSVGTQHTGPVYVTFGVDCDPLEPAKEEKFFVIGTPVSLSDYATLALEE